MSSEQLGAAQNVLKGNLGGAWDITNGYQDAYTDLGIARRFGGSAAAYSLRDIGAMNGRVVKVRRDLAGEEADAEEDFSASQVDSGSLENWVNGKLENTLPADVATAAAAYSLRKVKASYGIPTTVVNGTENFPSTVPESGSPADLGNGFTLFKISGGDQDSNLASVSGGVLKITATKGSAGAFNCGARVKGLVDGKQYTVKGEFRVTSLGADGDALARVDVSDATSGTDEDFIETNSTSFVPFYIDSGYSSGSSVNFVDFHATSNGDNSGTITAEFRNFQIIENENSAVRIRRSSDDAEVVVGFDSENKVSSTSPIVNHSEGSTVNNPIAQVSTTATTLGDFLTQSSNEVGTAANGTGSFDNYTVSNLSTTGFSADNSAGGTGSAGFPYAFVDNDVIVVRYTVSNFSSTSSLSPQIRGTTGTNSVTSVASGGTTFTANGTYTDTLTASANGTHLMFADGNTGSYTISDFQIVSHNNTAFVHTWYDQAGSNNAVQTTAANQPKIAESGALLADGLDFDGANDFLESTTLSSIYTGTDTVSSAFIVVNSDAASTTQYIIGAGSTSASNPMYNTLFHSGADTIGWQARDDAGTLKSNLSATPYVANQMYLVSNINSGTTTDFNSNAVIKDNGADSDVGAKTINTVKLGARGNGSTSPLNGSIKEAIFYAADQSNNRFRIESNINNYYDLYNDANETSATEFSFLNQRSGGVTVSNGVSGLTLDVETASAFAGFQLKEKVIVDDIIYLSFNADLTGGSGGTASPKVALRETSISNTVRSNQFDITEGFNTVELTSTNANAEYLVFSEGDDNRIFTISDLKVSRIERNGFVPTWYDQSGNSDDAVQATAGSQPKIVLNGGIVRLNNGKPAIIGDGTDDFLQAGYFYSAGDVDAMSTFSVCSNNVDTGLIANAGQVIISAGSGFNSSYKGMSTYLDKNTNGNALVQRVRDDDGGRVTSRTGVAQGGNILAFTFYTKDSTHLVKAITTADGELSQEASISNGAFRSGDTSGALRIGADRTFQNDNFFNLPIAETMVFKSDLRNEGIEDIINQFYNI